MDFAVYWSRSIESEADHFDDAVRAGIGTRQLPARPSPAAAAGGIRRELPRPSAVGFATASSPGGGAVAAAVMNGSVYRGGGGGRISQFNKNYTDSDEEDWC